MALPYDEGKAFLRVGPDYVHDWFGADTGGRTMPHTGIDVTPITRGDITVQIRSVYGGKVVETGFDKESGNYVIIYENDNGWWGYGHNSKNLVKAGDVVEPGQPIALVGMTGGARGVHCHIWRAISRDAALRIVHGYTNLKNGRTTEQWAASMGLTDPLPAIKASPAAQDGFLMALSDYEQKELLNLAKEIRAALRVPGAAYDWLPALNNKIESLGKVSQEARDALLKPVGGFAPIDIIRTHVVATLPIVKLAAETQGVKLDEEALVKDVIAGFGEALLKHAAEGDQTT